MSHVALSSLEEDGNGVNQSMATEDFSQRLKAMYLSPYYNICLLALAWAATLTTSTLLTTVGPLSVKSLGASDSAATFSIGIFLIGAAISSVPSGWLFGTLGRQKGFLLGCFGQILGSAFGVIGINYNKVWVVLMGCMFVGFGQGIGQFYRFSATEMTPNEIRPRAVTYVLAGGILAAFLGPISANYSADFFGKQYQGSFAAMAIIGLGNILIVMMVRFVKLPGEPGGEPVETKPKLNLEDEELTLSPARRTSAQKTDEALLSLLRKRPLKVIIKQPLFIVSCIIPTVAHTLMVMLMSSVTLAMVASGFGFSDSAMVMELHFLAMFSPGFVTGSAIQRYGTLIVSIVGGVFFASSCVVMALGETIYSYSFGMILCGIGWNLSFSAGTVMLMGSYRPEEATYVQAFNDFVLFSVAGGNSLVSGWIFSTYGWSVLVYTVSVIVVLNMGFFIFAWRLRAVLEANEDKPLYEAISPGGTLGEGEYPSDNEDEEEKLRNGTGRASSVLSESGWWRHVDSETEFVERKSSSGRQLSTEGKESMTLRSAVL